MTSFDAIWRKHTAGLLKTRGRASFRMDPAFCVASKVPEDREDAPRNLYQALKLKSPGIDKAIQQIVTDPELQSAMAAGSAEAFELAFELINVGDPVDQRISDFSKSHYLEHHEDVSRKGVDPLQHFVLHGANEGRWTLASQRQMRHEGAKGFDRGRRTCMICLHEMSRSGAPIVALDMVRDAAKTHNVIVAALRGGPLLEEFTAEATAVLISPRPLADFQRAKVLKGIDVDFAVLNSAVAHPFLSWLVAVDIPFISYVHEYSDYIRPSIIASYYGTFSDMIAFSSESLKASWSDILAEVNHSESGALIVPQLNLQVGATSQSDYTRAKTHLSELLGRDLTNARLICGAGQLNWRKGVDLFIAASAAAKAADPDCVFVWIGDGLSSDDVRFGVWIQYQLKLARANSPGSNIFLLPGGANYHPLLAASDAMFVSSRLDPLPNVAFDAVAQGCRVVTFDGATGFQDQVYRKSGQFTYVRYADASEAAKALLGLPRKQPSDEVAKPRSKPNCFSILASALDQHLKSRRHFVLGESKFDVPLLQGRPDDAYRPLRIREREKMLSYRRRLLWRDVEDVRTELAHSRDDVHGHCRIVDYGGIEPADLPPFSVHVHAYHTEDLDETLSGHGMLRKAQRIVITTDTEKKARGIDALAAAQGLRVETVVVGNQGRDVLPFLNLFRPGTANLSDDIWCHLHMKKSASTTPHGDRWRKFMLRILLGDEVELSNAPGLMSNPKVGLVAPLDPHYLSWGASKAMLPRIERRLGRVLPLHPIVFPMGNMFWARSQVVRAMYELFGEGYPWPNEPISSDGTEFHVIERLWPSIAANDGLQSVFIHKADEKRI